MSLLARPCVSRFIVVGFTLTMLTLWMIFVYKTNKTTLVNDFRLFSTYWHEILQALLLGLYPISVYSRNLWVGESGARWIHARDAPVARFACHQSVEKCARVFSPFAPEKDQIWDFPGWILGLVNPIFILLAHWYSWQNCGSYLWGGGWSDPPK